MKRKRQGLSAVGRSMAGMDSSNTPAEGDSSAGAGSDEVDAFLAQIRKEILENGPPQRTELFGEPVMIPLPQPGQATTSKGVVRVDLADWMRDQTQRWGTGGGKTVAIHDVDAGALIERVEIQIPDGYPEGTRATRCSGCGEVRFVTPDASVDVWRKHFDHCGVDDVAG